MKKVRRNCHQICLIIGSVLLLQSNSLFASNVSTDALDSMTTKSSSEQSSGSIVKGKVIDNLGLTLPGAVVQLSGSKHITSTDLDGNFTLSVPDTFLKGEIIISFMGFEEKKMIVSKGDFVNVTLVESSSMLNEVVVTALGIKREEKQLGFSQQTLNSEQLDNTRSNTWSDALKGKVAGMTMTSASSGPMNSTQIKLRGDRSLNADANGALVVVDGVIVNSTLWSSGAGDSYIGTDAPVDYGNGIADINPDDIESISVLKGPGAAALYGSRASNGVLMITTKSGKKDKGLGISFNSNVSFDVIQRWPKYQYEYGQGSGNSFDKEGNPYYSYGLSDDGANTGSTSSAFGPKFEGQYYYQYDPTTETQGAERTLWRPYKNNIKDFWRTGITTTNTLGLSGGSDKGDIRTTITHSKNEWIMPNTGFDRTTLSTKAKYNISDAVTLNANVSYTNRKSDNLPGTGYGNHTIGYFMIFQNPNVDLEWYRPIWKKDYNQTQQIHPFSSYIENPYLIAYETTNPVNTNTITGSLSTDITLAPKLKLMLRAALNSRNDKREQRRPYSTTKFGKGYFRTQQINFQEINTDVLLTYTDNDSDIFTYSGSIGGNMLDSKYHSVTSYVDGLVTPGVYMLANGINNPITNVLDDDYKVNSVYGMASVGYKNMVFLDGTIRNDWSSTLPKMNWSFLYSSLNASFVLNDIFRMPASIDYSKLRVSIAKVGNGTKPYQTLKYYSNSAFASSATSATTLHNGELKPEGTNSFEIGYEHKMFGNRLGFDVTVYETNTKNQIITVPLNYVTGYNKAVINGGDVRNRGIELMLSGTPIKTKDFSWNTSVNWAKNKNKILSLAEEFEGGDQQVLATSGTASIIAKVGGTTGDLYGYKFVRDDQGQIVYTDKGLPEQSKEIEYIGSAYADWTMGWTNTFKYKGFKFSFTIDGQYGGNVYSQSHHKMSEQGKLEHTLYGREQGYIIGDGVVRNGDGTFSPNTTKVDPASYYKEYYRRANLESNTFDASYIKLREVSFEYNFSKQILNKLRLKKLSVSVYGRNLAMLSNFPLFDPETAALNGGSMMPGVEMGQMPSPATYGFSIKLDI
ncbi:SusC/RagA family TonB-linked outer membrane protein [Myroides odoratimimus]|uniref:SusC/RagA family TonB-linked outer membrane protein n=1 Tax=Myroides odoratimimus TaxID=76832 RepID=UPI00257740B2|nr:SusC/RagA family TonB-linked outer membrane protein [Myroides odoratimimus]MDM1451836.1 SusC/RagA family TonB-linked outer membrane protein [Myroides odoratimimus]MDM1475825.1 SusC/RagA family TonB-linked outer membrane protein [Myroides odoratimimus]MDM1487886.1 SusC/RagA family TonB-linked outer membrane protein [Myroides odoratimimus]